MIFSRALARGVLAAMLLGLSTQASAFCGFYVGKADTKLFNKASKVVMVRDEDKTVITMSNDYQGELKEFAMVVPVPEVLKRKQINIGEQGVLDHLDAYTAPRLAEYFDYPCMHEEEEEDEEDADDSLRMSALGKVKIEASYTVGEYDILILSAKESDGLQQWLEANGYKVPAKAKRVLGSYLKQDMKFFVAKVNLEAQGKSGFQNLRPLQIAFQSRKFMLPIRLGTVNAEEDQELFVFALTRKGRVETTNYRTVKLPADKEVPQYLKEEGEFGRFYKAMFDKLVRRHDGRAVILEYAWDMSWCDPCAANPLSTQQLRKLGVWWVEDQVFDQDEDEDDEEEWDEESQPVYITRLHLRYNAETFPEDLMFQVTNNKRNFQGRYVIRNRWIPQHGDSGRCDVGEYRRERAGQEERSAQNLANLTGWDVNGIRQRQGPLWHQGKDMAQQPKKASPVLVTQPSPKDKKKPDGWLDHLWD